MIWNIGSILVIAATGVCLAATHQPAWYWTYPGYASDEALYFQNAVDMAAGRTYIPLESHGNLNAVLWAIGFLFTGPSLRTALVINWLAALVAAVVLAAALRRVGVSGLARVAALALGFLEPKLWQYTALYSEPAFLLAVAMFILSLSAYWTPRRWWVTGIAAALPLYGRLVWAGILPAYLLLSLWVRPVGATRRHWLGVAAAAALTLVPLASSRARHFGDPWFLRSAHVRLFTTRPSSDPAAVSQAAPSVGERLAVWIAGLRPDWTAAWPMVWGAYGRAGGWVLMTSILAGLAMLAARWPAAALTALWWLAGMWILAAFDPWATAERHFVPTAVVLFPLAVAGWDLAAQRAAGWAGRIAVGMALIGLCAVQFRDLGASKDRGYSLAYVTDINGQLLAHQRAMGLLNRVLDWADPTRAVPVMCANFFGAGRPAIATPNRPSAEVFARAMASGVGFYLTHGWMDDELAVNRALWTDRLRPPRGWRLLFAWTDAGPFRLRLYGIGRTLPDWAVRHLAVHYALLSRNG